MPGDRRTVEPTDAGRAVALIGTCLALVKPVGMGDADAKTWLRLAAQEVRHLPIDILTESCAAARKVCTHHGQIVPAIIKAGDDWLASRRKLVRHNEAMSPAPQLPAPPPWLPTQEELDQIKVGTAAALKADR